MTDSKYYIEPDVPLTALSLMLHAVAEPSGAFREYMPLYPRRVNVMQALSFADAK